MTLTTNIARIAPRALSPSTMEILDRYAARAGYRSATEILAGRTREPALDGWNAPWWVRS